MPCAGCAKAPAGMDGPNPLGDVLDGLSQAPLATPRTSGNPGANVGTQLGIQTSAPTFGADTPNSSSPAVRDIWHQLTTTPKGASIPALREQQSARYKPRLTWGGYPPGFVTGNRPAGVSYDVAPAVPGENVSRQQYVANGGKGAAKKPASAGNSQHGGGTPLGGVPTGDVISGTPRVPNTNAVALGVITHGDGDTTPTPGNFDKTGTPPEAYTVPVVTVAAAGASDSAWSMTTVAAFALIGVGLIVMGR